MDQGAEVEGWLGLHGALEATTRFSLDVIAIIWCYFPPPQRRKWKRELLRRTLSIWGWLEENPETITGYLSSFAITRGEDCKGVYWCIKGNSKGSLGEHGANAREQFDAREGAIARIDNINDPPGLRLEAWIRVNMYRIRLQKM
jgi:hypothetical protein